MRQLRYSRGSDSDPDFTGDYGIVNAVEEDEEEGSWINLHQAHMCCFDCCQPRHNEANEELSKKAVEALRVAITEDGPPPISGNIYRYMAFMCFGDLKKGDSGQLSLFDPPEHCHNWLMMHMGIVVVAAVQVLAPLTILITSINALIESFDWSAWRLYDWSQWLVVMLAWGFLFLFILSTYFQISQDSVSGRKVARLARGLRYLRQPVSPTFLILDAAINGYVAVVVSLVMFAVLYQESSALDVLLDALGLAFLQNIDDIASDFGFLGGVWDDKRVGLFYAALDEQGVFRACGDPDDNDELRDEHMRHWFQASDNGKKDDDMNNNSSEATSPAANSYDPMAMMGGAAGSAASAASTAARVADDMYRDIPLCLNACTRCVLVALLVLAIPSPFILASSATSTVPVEEEAGA
mmetsp:Transcript_44567/g.105629  ORF Transcript_44567/g.105629 Transcript_44567/m.105629 type:complete len:410 (+) Transcript_44567:85-1314(+)|eukprot:CAMPEP_0178418574 /NCGR_PEP_ID=MMETSP0689_2-20121128/25159_1 /TAXON_ID=160604 /ORGANISM="Amphidinium massartii, Strain CS-259" /LENGTH=409 /DNA_ID=CAMNT_0020039973 /DNA_START=56 /DNA_END=1285 /DNA_ORIENTATION=-